MTSAALTISELLAHSDQREALIAAMDEALPRHSHTGGRDDEGDGMVEVSFTCHWGRAYRNEIVLRLEDDEVTARVVTWLGDDSDCTVEVDLWGGELEALTEAFSEDESLSDALVAALELADEQKKDVLRKVLGEDEIDKLFAD